MKRFIAVAALGLALTLTACAPNGTKTVSESETSAPTTTSAPTPTPTIHVAIEVSLEGNAVAWDDIVAIYERGDFPVLWLTPEAGSTLTIVGSSVVDSFVIDGMDSERNSDGDLVLSPALSPFDGSIKSSGGEVIDDTSGISFKVKAVQP